MNTPALVRFFHPAHGARLGVKLGAAVHDITGDFATPGAWLRASAGRVAEAIDALQARAAQSADTHDAARFDAPPAPDRPHWLAPVDEQDVWAAGVTYERSRQARREEAIDGGDIYARVYDAPRPELFFKAKGPWVVGPRGEVGIRVDATWSVPEPELGVMFNPAMEVVGFTVGNDMSSRDIEGENPLYLPQAKIYAASCALGPGVALTATPDWPDAGIYLTIRRAGVVAFAGETHTRRITRTIADLAAYLGRSLAFPDGVVLLTGTGVVPPSDFSLQAGDEVEIVIEGVGALVNTVKVV